jgi:hypothetical protein
VGSALGYFFSGVQTFGLVFVRGRWHAGQATTGETARPGEGSNRRPPATAPGFSRQSVGDSAARGQGEAALRRHRDLRLTRGALYGRP